MADDLLVGHRSIATGAVRSALTVAAQAGLSHMASAQLDVDRVDHPFTELGVKIAKSAQPCIEAAGTGQPSGAGQAVIEVRDDAGHRRRRVLPVKKSGQRSPPGVLRLRVR